MYVVYCWKAGSSIVYVGSTERPQRRIYENQRAPWWLPVFRLEVLSSHSTRRAAYTAELVAIHEHRPMFNVQGNPDYARAVA